MTAGLANALFEAHALVLDLNGSGLSTYALGVTASGLITYALVGPTASGLSTAALGVVSLSGTSCIRLSPPAFGASGGQAVLPHRVVHRAGQCRGHPGTDCGLPEGQPYSRRCGQRFPRCARAQGVQ